MDRKKSGHRSRMISNFISTPSNFSNLDIIKLLLFIAIPRKDITHLATSLYSSCTSLNDLFTNINLLPVTDNVKMICMLCIEITNRLNYENIHNKPITTNYNDLITYLRVLLSERIQEELLVIFQNNKGNIIKIQTICVGTLNQVQIYPREIFRKCFEYGSNQIILVHNHPTKDPTPSSMDIQMTKHMKQASSFLDISIEDHIIIGGNHYFSFKQNNLL